jgi:hypothetical protein
MLSRTEVANRILRQGTQDGLARAERIRKKVLESLEEPIGLADHANGGEADRPN